MCSAKVVFRIAKLKSWGEVGGAGSHNHRERSTPNANTLRCNVVIVAPSGGDVVQQVKDNIGKQTVRKNAVLAVEVIASASPEYFRPTCPDRAGYWEPEKLEAWRKAMEPWIAEKFPYAASVVLHLDEATPHYQIIDVPLVDGKLNCRCKYSGDSRRDIGKWQTLAAEPVASLGIERGIEGSQATHTRIAEFYGAANAPVPALPFVKTKAPAPLPEPTLAEQVPFTKAKAERDKIEAEHAAQKAQRNREFGMRNAEAAKLHPQIAQKANFADLAQRKQREAEATAAKLAKANAEHKSQADKLRALPIPDVLTRVYGAEEAPDSKHSYRSRKFDLPDGRQIAVTDDKWIEQGGKGGKGAINLAMHLDALEFKSAVRLLADHYDAQTLAAERTRQLADQAAREVAEATTEPAPTPAPAPGRWPKVRQWLEEVRGIPAKLSDWLHEKGIVFADERGNAVFAREKGGAFVRGTSEGSTFKRTIGKADAGAFMLPGNASAGIYMVEGPIDAMAIKAISPDAIVIATGGNLISPSKMAKRMPPGAKVFAAFDWDDPGHKMADEAAKTMGAERYAPPDPFKDWSECVKNEPWRVSKEWGGTGGRAAAG